MPRGFSRKRNSVKSPSLAIHHTDAGKTNSYAAEEVYWVGYRHGGAENKPDIMKFSAKNKVNVSFLDGHVAPRNYTELTSDSFYMLFYGEKMGFDLAVGQVSY